MSALKGQYEYEKFREGGNLTRKQAILAHCYACNGENEGGADCKGRDSCSLYQFFPYRQKGVGKRNSKALKVAVLP